MNREIIFRGKRTDNGEWIEGLLARYNPLYKVSDIIGKHEVLVPVYTETVGQFTGEKDRDGNKIFEGDILEVSEGHYDSVSFGEGCFWMDRAMMFGEFSYGVDKYKVVGNLWDTPDLLQG